MGRRSDRRRSERNFAHLVLANGFRPFGEAWAYLWAKKSAGSRKRDPAKPERLGDIWPAQASNYKPFSGLLQAADNTQCFNDPAVRRNLSKVLKLPGRTLVRSTNGQHFGTWLQRSVRTHLSIAPARCSAQRIAPTLVCMLCQSRVLPESTDAGGL
jgi:hypothetical protein